VNGSLEELAWYGGLVIVGIAAGFINTLAGGGSLFALPVLMIAGLPAQIANGTNRVAVFAQSLAGTAFFDREGQLDRTGATAITLPTLVGSLAGALTAAALPGDVLKPVLLVAMVSVALLLIVHPNVLAPAAGSEPRRLRDRPSAVLGLFAVGYYGGFAQAGVGIFLLAILGGLLRYDLVRANALKGLLITAFTGLSLLVFVGASQVEWIPGIVLGVGMVLGALAGVRFAIQTGHETLRRFVLAVAIVSCFAAWLK